MIFSGHEEFHFTAMVSDSVIRDVFDRIYVLGLVTAHRRFTIVEQVLVG